MSASKNSLRQAFGGPGRPLRGLVCRSCREGIARRRFASAAAAVVEAPSTRSVFPLTESPDLKLAYQLRAAVVLSRPPQITRDLHPFEKAFFLYQKRLNERLALPFTRYFYIRKDTPADIDYKKKVKERLTPARDIGKYSPYMEDGWHDEVLIGAPESEPEHQMEMLLKDVEVPVVNKFQGEEAKAKQAEEDFVQRPMPRTTEADRSGDQKSLNRMLARTLYLLVQNKEGRWMFPHDTLVRKENLHLAAERVIVQTGGLNMNTWVVGNAPIGYFQADHRNALETGNGMGELGQKTFFMKARIMGGQANLEKNSFGLSDFKWLAKEEVARTVDSRYWSNIRNMLSER